MALVAGLPSGGGAMGARLRAHDWSATALGPPAAWPQPLRTALGIVLNSGFPTLLAWGPDLACFYNDAFLRFPGTGPDALGQRFREVWPGVWDAVGPVAGRVLSGEAGCFEDLPLALERDGRPEETWWTFSCSPIFDETGRVGGVLATAHETTDRVSAERRLRFLVDVGARLRGMAHPSEVTAAAVAMLGRHLGADRACCGEVDPTGTVLTVESEWTDGGETAAAGGAGRCLLDELGEPLAGELRAGRVVRVDDAEADPRVPGGAAARAGPRSGVLVPLMEGGRLAAVFRARRAEPRRWRDGELAVAREVAQSTWEAACRLRAEAALRASEERFRQFADFVPAFLWRADAEGAITYVNDRWCAYTGRPPGEAAPDGWLDSLHPEDAERTRAAWLAAVHGGARYEAEHRMRGADGSHRWFLTRGEPLRDAEGRVVGWFGVATDTHDRREAGEALRASEELFRQFAEHSTDVLWILDAEAMRAEYLSPAFERVWGLPRSAFDGASRDRWLGTVHPDDRSRAAEAMERVRRGGAAVEEYRVVRADGAVRRIRDTFFPIRDARGRVTRVAGIAKDVTQHKGSLVYVVDGDPAIHEWLSRALLGAGYQVRAFGTVPGFLEAAPALLPGCVVLDIASPESGGLAVPRELKARRLALPVIATGSGGGGVGLAVRAMKAGAADFLEAPFPESVLLAAVASAMADIRASEGRDRAVELAAARVAEMSARERAVLDLLLAGGTNKTMARDLGISPRTVEVHRARVMERLGARTLPQAVLAAAAAGLKPPPAAPDGKPGPAS
jgi:PAS domain S-box-containing protein